MNMPTWLMTLERRFKVVTFTKAMLPTMGALGLQFLAFVVTARGLGAEQFGVYGGILALALIGGDVVGFGAIDLLSRGTARQRGDFGKYFGHLLRMTLLTLPVVAAVALLVALYVMNMHIAFWLLCSALCAEILFGRALSCLEAIMVAHGDSIHAAWVRLSGAAARMVAAAAYFLLIGRSDIEGWAVTIIVLTLTTVAVAYKVCVRLYGPARGWFAKDELGAGVVLCLTQIASTLQSNVDRVVLTRFASAADVGAYGAAVRVMQLGYFPLQVATRITYPKFFAPENTGPTKGLRFATRVAVPMILVGVMACLMVVAASFAVPLVLGKDFSAAQRIAVVLSFALPVIAIQTPPADALTAANLHSVRAAIYWACALGFVALALVGAKWGGALGIAFSFVGVQILLALSLWSTLAWMARGERRQSRLSAPV